MRLLIVVAFLGLGACAQVGGVKELFTGSLEGGRQPPPTPGGVSVAEVPAEAVEACRASIAEAANSLGAVQVQAASAGTPTTLPNGVTEAPLEARITYEQAGEVEIRQARVTCQLSEDGRVLALL